MFPPLQKGRCYHIYNQGNNKEKIFLSERNYEYFISLIIKHLVPFINIYAFSLIPNHFHLLVGIDEKSDMPDNKLHLPLSNLFNAYSQAFNKENKRTGSLFRDRYRRTLITDEAHFFTALQYIHLNHVKHGLSEKLLGYKWSSLNLYCDDSCLWIDKSIVLNWVSDTDNLIEIHINRKAQILSNSQLEEIELNS
ncbi:MAG: transposase [Bacteroidetes bacterium HGW-Bacteroidetes-6]|jgi:REP element-mobilizing transposase RayT|nr:MAG: transposase [Bacteroidetes bacterium HGW-Bacteroidetes-6]